MDFWLRKKKSVEMQGGKYTSVTNGNNGLLDFQNSPDPMLSAFIIKALGIS